MFSGEFPKTLVWVVGRRLFWLMLCGSAVPGWYLRSLEGLVQPYLAIPCCVVLVILSRQVGCRLEWTVFLAHRRGYPVSGFVIILSLCCSGALESFLSCREIWRSSRPNHPPQRVIPIGLSIVGCIVLSSLVWSGLIQLKNTDIILDIILELLQISTRYSFLWINCFV